MYRRSSGAQVRPSPLHRVAFTRRPVAAALVLPFALLVMADLTSLQSAAVEHPWGLLTSQAGRFSIMMPDTPQPHDPAPDIYGWQVLQFPYVYMVRYNDDAKNANDDPATILQKACINFTAGTHGNLEKQEDITV